MIKEHMVRLPIGLPVLVHAHLKQLSEQTGLGMAEHVRRALEPYLAAHPICFLEAHGDKESYRGRLNQQERPVNDRIVTINDPEKIFTEKSHRMLLELRSELHIPMIDIFDEAITIYYRLRQQQSKFPAQRATTILYDDIADYRQPAEKGIAIVEETNANNSN